MTRNELAARHVALEKIRANRAAAKAQQDGAPVAPEPELVTYRCRIAETRRCLALDFVARFNFGAVPEDVAEFTDRATALRVAAAAQRDLEAPSIALRLPSPATVEVVKVEWTNADEAWSADARADTAHRQARLLLAERRPAHLSRRRTEPTGLGAMLMGTAVDPKAYAGRG